MGLSELVLMTVALSAGMLGWRGVDAGKSSQVPLWIPIVVK